MSAQFLTSDDEHKLCYGGFCNIKVNALSKYLTFDPINEDLKPISASFDSIFIQEKHVLCVFSLKKVLIFSIIFKNESVCKKIMDCVGKYKTSNQETTISAIHKQQLFDEKFFKPLIDQEYNPKIAEIVSDLKKSQATNNIAAASTSVAKEKVYSLFKPATKVSSSTKLNKTIVVENSSKSMATNITDPNRTEKNEAKLKRKRIPSEIIIEDDEEEFNYLKTKKLAEPTNNEKSVDEVVIGISDDEEIATTNIFDTNHKENIENIFEHAQTKLFKDAWNILRNHTKELNLSMDPWNIESKDERNFGKEVRKKLANFLKVNPNRIPNLFFKTIFINEKDMEFIYQQLSKLDYHTFEMVLSKYKKCPEGICELLKKPYENKELLIEKIRLMPPWEFIPWLKHNRAFIEGNSKDWFERKILGSDYEKFNEIEREEIILNFFQTVNLPNLKARFNTPGKKLDVLSKWYKTLFKVEELKLNSNKLIKNSVKSERPKKILFLKTPLNELDDEIKKLKESGNEKTAAYLIHFLNKYSKNDEGKLNDEKFGFLKNYLFDDGKFKYTTTKTPEENIGANENESPN